MKVFWAVLLLIILAAAAYLVLGNKPAASGRSAQEAVVAPVPAPRDPNQKDNDEGAFFTLDAAPTASTPRPPTAVTPGELPKATAAPAPAAETPSPKAPEVPSDVKPTPAATPDPKPEPTPAEAPKVVTPAPPPPPAPQAGSSGAEFGDDAKIVKNEDGSMTVDDKYPVKGEGTKANPYQVTWEYLVSAQEEYQPRLGRKKLPGRMKLLNGKYVKITGFVAFPIMATEPTEMLSMLNQWDGCCIGIPPTPYDAIEVKLHQPADNDQRLVTFGTVQGKLHVEPYLVRDWLISLYTMEEATMERAQ